MMLGQGAGYDAKRVWGQLCRLMIVAWWVRECQGWSWIVASTPSEVNASAVISSAPPRCPSFCLNACGGNADANVFVVLWWCQGADASNERWIFNRSSSAISILNAAQTSSFCLDITDPTTYTNRTGHSSPQPPIRTLLLSECNSSSPTQQWSFEPGTLLLKSLSGFNSLNSSYVYAYSPTRQENYLSLTENATAAQPFIMIDSSVMASYYSPVLPPSNYSNLILNGNLKLLTSFAPLGLPLNYRNLKDQHVVARSNFVLCHWAVQTDLIFADCNSAMCSLPAEWCSGSNTHLRNTQDESLVFLSWLHSAPGAIMPGQIMQTVPTYPGSTYLLMFDMRNPFKQMQSVRISVSPVAASTSSTLQVKQTFQILSNETIDKTQEFRFTAGGSFVNVSFTGHASTPCGPLINNIQLYHRPDEDGPALGIRNSHSGSLLALAVVAGWVMAAAAALFFSSNAWYRRRRMLAGTMDGTLSANRHATALQPEIISYSFEQLKAYTQDFSILIGVGGFSKVYYGCSPESGLRIAVKRLDKVSYHGHLPDSGLRIAVKRQNDAEDTASFRAEVELLSRVHHRYIVKFLGYCDEEDEQMLVFEYMPNKSLFDRLHVEKVGVPPLSWAERLRIAYQVAYALEYLHHGATPPVWHRDVKSANVLLANTLAAKLADLGISKVGQGKEATHWMSTKTEVKGSMGYLDPYYERTGKLSQKSDVYSFGVLLLELVTGCKAFTRDLGLLTAWVKQHYWDQLQQSETGCATNFTVDNLEEPQQNILHACLRGSVCGSDVEVVMNIAHCCLHEEPDHRPSMLEVVKRLRDIQLPSPTSAGTHDITGWLGNVEVDKDKVASMKDSSTDQLLSGAASHRRPVECMVIR